MSSSYQKALDAGYSPEEIDAYWAEKNPKYEEARKQGYTPEEITTFLEKKPKESLGANIGRQVGRGVARTAETVLGAPRAIGDLVQSLIPEKSLKKGASFVGLEKPVGKLLDLQKEYAPHKAFPRSEDIRENVTKYLFGEKLEPKNKWEGKADEVISDFAALAIPMPGAQFKVLKPLMLSLGANAVSEGIGQVGGTDKQKAYGKIGTILAGSMINPKGADKLKSDLYNKAEAARPADAKVNAKSLDKSITHFESDLLKGDPNAGSKKKSLDLLKDLRSKIKNNEIEIEELEQFKRDINEARSGLYENFKTDKVGRKSAKRNLDTVSKFVDKSLNEYGQINPEWEAFYRPANEVHGAIAQSKRARNWMLKHAKKAGIPGIAAELGLYHTAGMAGALGGAVGVAAGVSGLGAGELLARVMKSPTLRKYYFNTINGALKEDAIVVRENLRKIEKEMKRED